MVDKKLKFLSRNDTYGIIEKSNPYQNINHNIVYSDGSCLNYEDPAEIFSAIIDAEIIPFMQSALAEGGYHEQYYGFTFGYLAASFDDEEIKDDEVSVTYVEAHNIIKKKEFYELCLLLCNAKLNGMKGWIEDKDLKREDLELIKSQLGEKIKVYGG